MYAEKLFLTKIFRDAARKNFATSRQFLNSGHPISDKDAFRWNVSIALWFETVKCSTTTLMELSEKIDDCSAREAYLHYATLARKGVKVLQRTSVLNDIKVQLDELKACLMVLRHFDLEIVKPMQHRRQIVPVYKDLLHACCAHYNLRRDTLTWEYLYSPLFNALFFNNTPSVFRELNTIFQFMTRVTFFDEEWQLEEAMSSYIALEEQLHDQKYDEGDLADLRTIANEWLKNIDFNVAVGQHGYGATAEVKRSHGTDAKWHAMLSHPSHESANVKRLLGWQPTKYCWPGLEQMWEETLHERALSHVTTLVGQIQFVAKDALRKRTVSKEPTVNMFWQKQIFQVLDRHFQRHPEMHIHLHDQGVNRLLALRGSRDGSFATIDLSNASDTVTRTIVWNILADHPKLRYLLAATRTTKACLGGTTVLALEKFAPMGSACCFPIECLVFSLICELCARRRGIDASNISIYGDDIVIPAELYDDVIDLLVKLHFQPNETKSYGHGSLFTEACGMEAYQGEDVSPVRLSRHWDAVAFAKGVLASCMLKGKNNLKPDKARRLRKDRLNGFLQNDSLTDLANFASFAGYLNLRTWIIRMIGVINPNPLFSNTGEGGIFTLRPLEEIYAKRISLNRNTWQPCVKVTRVTAKVLPGSEEARYSLNLEEISERSATERSRYLSLPYEDTSTLSAGQALKVIKTYKVPLLNLLHPQQYTNTALDVWSRYKVVMA